MVLRAQPRGAAPSHSPFLIYGTGIRNALNPRICSIKSVLIYGNAIVLGYHLRPKT